jgi:hypothetical protein
MNINNDRRLHTRIDHCGDYYIATGKIGKVGCELRNISPTGACIISGIGLNKGQEIELHICRNKDIPLRAQVVWIKDKEYGVSFLLDTAESFNNISYIINNVI